MNAQVTVLKSAQREAVATPLVAEELAQFAGAFSTERIPAAVTARAKYLDSRRRRHRARLHHL